MENNNTSNNENKKINNEVIKSLRSQTGAGIMDCKTALKESNGNIEKAIEYLRIRGLASATKKQSRITKDGVIVSYIHHGNRLGVLLEINCETDFVSRRFEFTDLAHDIAMQIAASPWIQFVSMKEIPTSLYEKEKKIEFEKDDLKDKTENLKNKIIEGRIQKTCEMMTLLEQPFIKNNNITIDEHIKKHIVLFGENIKVTRFVRFGLGETEDNILF
jgi:elongation factor Ts